MTITFHHYLVLSFLIFALGVTGVLVRRNALIVLMSVELMLNGANLALLGAARQLNDVAGHGLALFVMTVAAAEAAVGLAIVIAVPRHKETLDVDAFNLMKW